MTLFALEYQFPEDSTRRLEVRPRHRAYLQELAARGQVLAAGPFADERGALIVYDVSDAAALDRLLADDPYTIEDVYGARTVREWRPIIAGDLGGARRAAAGRRPPRAARCVVRSLMWPERSPHVICTSRTALRRS